MVGKNKEKAIVILDGINIKRLSINNEIDFRTKFGLPENSFIVGNVANHTKSKDLITFLKAANFIINNKRFPIFILFKLEVLVRGPRIILLIWKIMF